MTLSRLRALFTLIQFVITISIVIILMYIFRKKNHTIRYYWARMQLKLLGVKLEIKGQLDPNADMLMMNHQSMLDIVIFEALSDRNLAWVAKKEIGDIFWFGRILRLPKMIVVERESKTSLVKLLRDAKDRIDAGRPIGIFPEGTRSDGKRVKKFKAGAKMIAEKNKLKVQPIVMIGTRDILDSQNLKQNPGIVKITYLPIVQAEKKSDWYKDTEESMRTVLKKEFT